MSAEKGNKRGGKQYNCMLKNITALRAWYVYVKHFAYKLGD